MSADKSDKNDFQSKSIEDVLKELNTNKEKGLSDSEVQERIKKYGLNEITEKKLNPILKFLSYFWGPIPWMIEIAIVLSALIQHWEDFWIIFALLLLNAVVGFWQEHKADNAIELLKQKLALEARVYRDGKWFKVAAKELVPGDIVKIRLGDSIPADIKLFQGEYLMVDESALTGESLPVEKHEADVSYAGSIARQGEMIAVVVATAMNTFFGRTAKLVEEAKTQSHFQKAIIKIGDYLIVLAVILVVIIFIVALYRHESFLNTLQFALVLTVAAIPVALPAVMSVTLAIGAIALAKKEAIVSKLVSIEEMSGMDVLCSDKTGTITQNEISVAETVTFSNFKETDIMLFGTLASKEEDKDPIDNAIIIRGRDLITDADKIKSYHIETFKPFDPVSKRTEATVIDPQGTRFIVAKGAPQAILSLIGDSNSLEDTIKTNVNRFAEKGYRALGVALTDKNGKWQYAGLIALHDPPRDDSAETIKTAKEMGLNVKMVTGDHTAIAKEISRQVHLGTNIIEASSFEGKPDSQALKIIEEADGFAQVYPEHKYHIVELLQEKGHIVGMTGDGVNDAPALKKADAGIAVAGATDAAKSAAAIVLTRPGLSVIIDAIKQSRKIFQRMTNYAIYRIAETIRVLLFITASIIIFNFYPVTALMIVLLALLNDAPIMTIAYDNVKYANNPEQWNMRTILGIATMLGIFGVIESFFVLYVGINWFHFNQDVLQSFIYLKLSVAGHLTVFIARTKGNFWSVKPAKPLFFAVIITQAIATIITVYGILLPAMGWGPAIFVWAEALIVFLIIDFIKVKTYKLFDHSNLIFER
ncbi:MAG: plasma-membrane proton-efflux P-type ATPase [Ignavibacteriaceae bacterium]